MRSDTLYRHIVFDEDGVPMIAGTTMKVVELVLNHKAYGWGPEALQANHPALTLSQIHSALAYYWDHQEEIGQDIQRRLERVDQLQQLLEPSQMKKRLQANGVLG